MEEAVAIAAEGRVAAAEGQWKRSRDHLRRAAGLLYHAGRLDDVQRGDEGSGQASRSFRKLMYTGDQYPSMGCGIKWKPGNEPGYG